LDLASVRLCGSHKRVDVAQVACVIARVGSERPSKPLNRIIVAPHEQQCLAHETVSAKHIWASWINAYCLLKLQYRVNGLAHMQQAQAHKLMRTTKVGVGTRCPLRGWDYILTAVLRRQ
jgi:hypothetical protein